jgi:hypothetical protein
MTTSSHQEKAAIPTNTKITAHLNSDYNGNFGLARALATFATRFATPS